MGITNIELPDACQKPFIFRFHLHTHTHTLNVLIYLSHSLLSLPPYVCHLMLNAFLFGLNLIFDPISAFVTHLKPTYRVVMATSKS